MTLAEVQVKRSWWIVGTRCFLNIANERSCFASHTCAFEDSRVTISLRKETTVFNLYACVNILMPSSVTDELFNGCTFEFCIKVPYKSLHQNLLPQNSNLKITGALHIKWETPILNQQLKHLDLSLSLMLFLLSFILLFLLCARYFCFPSISYLNKTLLYCRFWLVIW